MKLLDNVIQPYAWGSKTAIPELMGRTPTGTPQAELWMGAHPGAPSKVTHEQNQRSLIEHIAANPRAELGTQSHARFGSELPFLLKVLAAGTPLSLQTHPSLAQAREGFAREEAAGIPRDATHRNYKDANHKPELLCALTPFHALCGFREPRATLELFDALQVPALAGLTRPLRSSPDEAGLRAMFEQLMSAPRGTHNELVNAVVAACARAGGAPSSFSAEYRWAPRLAELYPGDAGILGALMLNLLELAPLEAVYLPAGNLHAYLEGVGVEIMASSDNVLRGGCTPKHVDPAELLRVLDFHAGPVDIVHPERNGEGEDVYRTPTDEFRLARLRVNGQLAGPRRREAEILLCTEGTVHVRAGESEHALRSGHSLFISAADPAYQLSGRGTLFRATSGLPPAP